MSAFPDTHWSRLAHLAARSEAERKEALRWFAGRYWQPVHSYVCALRGAAADNVDLTQQFFTTLLERKDLEALSPGRGSVRGFLKVALKNFLANCDRAARARPHFLPIEALPETVLRDPAASPEEAFDQAWVHQLLTEAIEHLRRQLETEGRHTQFELFEAYCLSDDQTVSYRGLAERFGMKPEDARNRVRNARDRMMEIVHDLVAESLGPDQNVDAEVRALIGPPP